MDVPQVSRELAENYAREPDLRYPRSESMTVERAARLPWRALGSPIDIAGITAADLETAREYAAEVAPDLADLLIAVELHHVESHADRYRAWSQATGDMLRLVSRAARGQDLTQDESDALTVLAATPITVFAAGGDEGDRAQLEHAWNASATELRRRNPARWLNALRRQHPHLRFVPTRPLRTPLPTSNARTHRRRTPRAHRHRRPRQPRAPADREPGLLARLARGRS